MIICSKLSAKGTDKFLLFFYYLFIFLNIFDFLLLEAGGGYNRVERLKDVW
jgi:hypothetical protein